jgi:hemerythrin
MQQPEIVWSEQFEVGHKDLDGEHQRLVMAVNAIYLAAGDPSKCNKVNFLLDELMRITVEHFKHENSILLQIGRRPVALDADRVAFIAAVADAILDQHIASRSNAFHQLSSIIGDIRKAVSGGTRDLDQDLAEWFVNHMSVHDARLKPIFVVLARHQKIPS